MKSFIERQRERDLDAINWLTIHKLQLEIEALERVRQPKRQNRHENVYGRYCGFPHGGGGIGSGPSEWLIDAMDWD